jgi:hypothetical protein
MASDHRAPCALTLNVKRRADHSRPVIHNPQTDAVAFVIGFREAKAVVLNT